MLPQKLWRCLFALALVYRIWEEQLSAHVGVRVQLLARYWPVGLSPESLSLYQMSSELMGEDRRSCGWGEIYSKTSSLVFIGYNLKVKYFIFPFWSYPPKLVFLWGTQQVQFPLFCCRVAVRAGCWFPPVHSAEQTGKHGAGDRAYARAVCYHQRLQLKFLFLSPGPGFSCKSEHWTWVFSSDCL